MDDDYGADDDLLAAMATAEMARPAQRPVQQPTPQKIQQPTPQKIQQPTPQRLDKAPPAASSSGKVVQPTPQALPQKPSGSNILVSPRQRGNPVLTSIRSMPWEYSDIPADYAMGFTTCALFLSLKYHRLHPEYIYTRIRNLQGKYVLRVMLTMVDIPNHEDALRELSKTSLVNNVTIILCWSAAEAARYIELYKSYENASFAAIKGQQSSSYSDKLIDFVTTPKSLNKSDAVALIANFGSLKNAVNADQEQLGMISGWGGTKVKRWSAAVDAPFRVVKSKKRGVSERGQDPRRAALLNKAVPVSRGPSREASTSGPPSSARAAPSSANRQFRLMGDVDDDEEEAMVAAAIEESKRTSQAENAGLRQPESGSQASKEDELSGGVAAALAKLREGGG